MMKKFLFKNPLFACLFLLIFASAATAQGPVALTPGSFNCDVVAENAPAENYITCCGPDGDVVYSPSYPDVDPTTGMPASNKVITGALTYQLQAYDQANVMRLENYTGSAGTMTFANPTPAAALHFLATSVYGETSVDIVVNFTDNSTEQIATNFEISDWFFETSNVAYILNGRVTCYDYVYNVNSDNPRLYTYGFGISAANQSKPIGSVTITRTGGPETSMPYFFAISSLTGCGRGKFLVCHIPAGNPGNPQQLCLPFAAALSHIGNHGGCYWGACSSENVAGGNNTITLAPQLLGTSDRVEDNSNPLVETTSGAIYYFDLSPNPASDIVNIHLHGHSTGSQLQLYDPSGRLVWNRSVDAEESSLTVSLTDKKLVNGTYYMTLLSNGERITRQFVVVSK